MNVNSDRELTNKEIELFYYKFGKVHSDQIIQEVEQQYLDYPDIEVPNSIELWFVGFHKSMKKRKRLKINRVAGILIGLMVGFSVLSVISDANGVNYIKMLINDEMKYSEIKFENTSEISEASSYLVQLPEHWSSFYYLSKLPNGYAYSNTMEGFENKYLIFANENGDHLTFMQDKPGGTVQIDTENAVVTEIQVNGLNGIASVKEDVTILLWNDNSSVFTLIGSVKLDVMLKVAESVKFKK